MSPNAFVLSRAQVREVDRRAIKEYGLPGIVLMENAGRNAAEIIAGLSAPPGPVAILCGRGNNGGDGFVIGRHLSNRGYAVQFLLAGEPDKLTGDAATNHGIVERMGLPLRSFASATEIAAGAPLLREAAVIVDALLGTGFSGEVRPPLDAAIGAVNAARSAPRAPLVIAIDVPSGLDCDTGRPCGATIRADHTITFVARKIGFAAAGAAAYTGEVHVVDIGAPRDIVVAVQSGGQEQAPTDKD